MCLAQAPRLDELVAVLLAASFRLRVVLHAHSTSLRALLASLGAAHFHPPVIAAQPLAHVLACAILDVAQLLLVDAAVNGTQATNFANPGASFLGTLQTTAVRDAVHAAARGTRGAVLLLASFPPAVRDAIPAATIARVATLNLTSLPATVRRTLSSADVVTVAGFVHASSSTGRRSVLTLTLRGRPRRRRAATTTVSSSSWSPT